VPQIAVRDASKTIVMVRKLVSLNETTMATLRLPGTVSEAELVAYARDRLTSSRCVWTRL